MIAKKLIKTATPSGQSVKFWMLQANSLGSNFGTVLAVAGMMIIVITKHKMLMTVPTELKLAIHKVGMLLMQASLSLRVSNSPVQIVVKGIIPC